MTGPISYYGRPGAAVPPFLQEADPFDLRNVVARHESEIRALNQKVLDVAKLEDITQDMGAQQSGDFFGRFIAPTDPEISDPGAEGFGGMAMDSTGLHAFLEGDETVRIDLDGDVFIGEDVSDPDKTYFVFLSNAQTYNGEEMVAGTLLIGSNSTMKANIKYDPETGQLQFRGGQDTEAYISSEGNIVFGGGVGWLNSDGAAIVSQTSIQDVGAYKFVDPSGENVLGGIFGQYVEFEGIYYNNIFFRTNSLENTPSWIYIYSTAPEGSDSKCWMGALGHDIYTAQIQMAAFANGTTSIQIVSANGNIQLMGGSTNVLCTDGFLINSIRIDPVGAAEGDVLTFDGEKFSPAAPTGGGVEEAPEDGSIYGRKNGGWEEISAVAGGGDDVLSYFLSA